MIFFLSQSQAVAARLLAFTDQGICPFHQVVKGVVIGDHGGAQRDGNIESVFIVVDVGMLHEDSQFVAEVEGFWFGDIADDGDKFFATSTPVKIKGPGRFDKGLGHEFQHLIAEIMAIYSFTIGFLGALIKTRSPLRTAMVFCSWRCAPTIGHLTVSKK